MYSRLYQNVLNPYAWVQSAQSFVRCVRCSHKFAAKRIEADETGAMWCSCYTDAGLFGILSSSSPSHLGQLVRRRLASMSMLFVLPAKSTRSKGAVGWWWVAVVGAQQAEVICTELYYTCKGINDIEFTRAKNQLKSSIFFNLESRAVHADDIGRQLLFQRCARARAVSLASIRRG
jgi:hypothetical protein